jgi:hypothetical protein
MGFKTFKNLREYSKRTRKKIYSNFRNKVMLRQLDYLQEERCIETFYSLY